MPAQPCYTLSCHEHAEMTFRCLLMTIGMFKVAFFLTNTLNTARLSFCWKEKSKFIVDKSIQPLHFGGKVRLCACNAKRNVDIVKVCGTFFEYPESIIQIEGRFALHYQFASDKQSQNQFCSFILRYYILLHLNNVERRDCKRIAAESDMAVRNKQSETLQIYTANKVFLQEEKNYLHELLPEVWKYILPYLSGPDFLSLLNFSLQLGSSDAFKLEKTRKLLPLVLPILLTNQPGIKEKSILDLRKINRAAKQAMDSMIDQEYSPQRYWERITTHHMEWTTRYQNLNRCDRLINMHYAEAFSTAPFLGRRFEIYSYALHFVRNAEFIEKFFSYMVEHGHNVSQLVCKNLGYAGYLYRLLPLLPNLRVLKLVTSDLVEDHDEHNRPGRYPLLPHLELLDVDGIFGNFRDHESTVISLNNAFVMNYGCQLKAINCCDHFFKGWWRYTKWYSLRLKNLEKIRVTEIGSGSYAFTILRCVNLPNLKELHFHSTYIKGCHSYMDRYPPFQIVLDVVNNFAKTLSSFHLFLEDKLLMDNEGKTFREGSMLVLPKMTLLNSYLCNVHSTTFWQFVELKCQNLEQLRFEVGRRDDRLCLDDVVRDSLRTRAFALVPKLKSIMITIGTLDNQMYCPKRMEITRAGREWRRLSRDEG